MEDLHQLMKYVDWLKTEYAFGDYSIIDAFAVAHEYDKEVTDNLKKIVERKYIYGIRPSKAAEWSNVKLVRYTTTPESDILFHSIEKSA